jgi:hypothetical protein
MKILKVFLLLILIFFNSCKASDSTIDRTTITYQEKENKTSINNFLVLNLIKINGKWDKTYYIDEYNRKKKNYFLYLKQGEEILGLFFKNNNIAKNNFTDFEYFTNTLDNEFNLLDKANLIYLKGNTDKKTYQTYMYQDFHEINFHGLIGIKNNVVYHLTFKNDNLNNSEKEAFLIDMFTTMKP